MQTMENKEMLNTLRAIFPNHMPKMEAATTEEEFYAVHDNLMKELRQDLRTALATANIPEENFASLLASNREGEATEAHEIDAVSLDRIINARGDTVKEVVNAMFNGLSFVGNSPRDTSIPRMAARLVANRLIAAGASGIQGANNRLKEYQKLSPTEINALNADILEALNDMSEEERSVFGSAAFAGATAAAVAGLTASAGTLIVIAVILIIVALLIPFLVFLMLEAACVILVVNDIRNNDGSYEKYKLINIGSHNIHGKETGYVPELTSPITVEYKGETYVFAVGGFYTTEKRTAAWYGTQYGFTFEIANTNHTVSFGVECPLSGNNKCYCDFNISAKDAANKVSSKLTHEAKIDGFKAHIAMNSTSGRTAYYICRVTDVL